MRKYEAPKMQVIELAKNDVIMTSGSTVVTPGGDGNVSNPTPED